MNRGDMPDGTPTEAKEFQVPPEQESKNEKIPPSPSGTDRQPTEDELRFYRTMTREEWDERVLKGKEEIASIEAQRGEDRRQRQEEQRNRFERKIRALQSIQPTGDSVEDARAFFEAIDFDPNQLDSPYDEAYRKSDQNSMLRYFKNIGDQAGELPLSNRESISIYFRTLDRVVKSIIAAAEARANRT
jgi:hypothetical protein